MSFGRIGVFGQERLERPLCLVPGSTPLQIGDGLQLAGFVGRGRRRTLAGA